MLCDIPSSDVPKKVIVDHQLQFVDFGVTFLTKQALG